MKWITNDVESYINSSHTAGLTPFEMIDHRRWKNERWAHLQECDPDEDPEQAYQAFMNLVQKIVDDHYDFDADQKHDEEGPRKRMIAVPREGSNRFLDVVEGTSIVEVFNSDTEPSETEDLSDQEDWDDAPEYKEEDAETETGNEEAD